MFGNRDFAASYDMLELLPHQHKSVAGAFVGSPDNVGALFRTAKGVLETLPRYAHCGPLSFGAGEKPVWAENVLWTNIYSNDEAIGVLALLSGKSALSCGIKNNAVMLFELDMDALSPMLSRSNEFAHLPEYPMTDFDVSMLFDHSVKWEDIHSVIQAAKGGAALLHDFSFVGEYRGPQIPDGQKSVTFRLAIGSLNKTLTSEEIESCAASVVKRLQKALGAQLRN